MKSANFSILAIIALAMLMFSAQSQAVEAHSVVGVGGYDLVSYHSGKKPLQGNGNHVVRHEGVNYLFASQANADTFSADIDKYLPKYGGYCAYGVAVGKKFIAAALVERVASAERGIACTWVRSIHLLCKLSLRLLRIPLPESNNHQNSMY